MTAQTTRYAAVLAKIGNERSTLLTDAKLMELTESKSLEEFTAQLRETTYAEITAKITSPINSRKIEHALKEILIETYTKIAQYSPKNVHPFLVLRLIAIEVENIKTLLKSITANFTMEEKLGRIHLSAEKHLKHTAIFEEAARATDLRTLINALGRTSYLAALTLGLQRHEETGSTQYFDILLDKEYYDQMWTAFQKLPHREKKHAFFYASLENDSFTIITILRGKILGHDPNWLRIAVPSNRFRIQKEITEEMVTAPDLDSAIAVAQKTYSSFFSKAPAPEEAVANAQKAFKKALLNHAYASIIRETFNIEAPLALITQKEVETRNLEAIAVGLEIGRTREDMRSTLLLQS